MTDCVEANIDLTSARFIFTRAAGIAFCEFHKVILQNSPSGLKTLRHRH